MPTVAAPSVQGEGVVRQRVRRLETLEQMPACETHRFEVCDERRPLALLPAAHVQLRFVAVVAGERLKCCVLLEDRNEVLRLLDADVVVKKIHRHDRPLVVVL